jgi:hypothetical protein
MVLHPTERAAASAAVVVVPWHRGWQLPAGDDTAINREGAATATTTVAATAGGGGVLVPSQKAGSFLQAVACHQLAGL